MRRVFIAADLSEHTRKAIIAAAEPLRKISERFNFVPSENLHITLEFLGNVEDKIIPIICNAVEKSLVGFGQFEFVMQGITRMPPDKTVRMIWANVGDGAGRLEKLVERLTSAMGMYGFLPEARPFRPHVTICRINSISHKEQQRVDDAMQHINSCYLGRTTLREVTVYESILGSPASKYIPLKKCKL